MKLYHYMDEVFGLKNLSNRRIKASTFDNLNDPFELLGIETSTPYIRASLNRMKLGVSREFGILCFSGLIMLITTRAYVWNLSYLIKRMLKK